MLFFAATTIEISDAGNRVQLFPAGVFRAVDGRPHDAPHWFMDATLAQALIDAAAAKKVPYCFDYEHQTLHAQKNGQPAPAAGWFSRLEWEEGVGLFAVDVTWTDKARDMINAGEYRFISPLFNYDSAGNVRLLINAALTNTPALDDMEALTAAASQLITGENTVDELLEQLRWMLNLPISATKEDVLAELKKLAERLSVGEGTAATSVSLFALLDNNDQKIAALSAKLDAASDQPASNEPDPTQYTPNDVVKELRETVAALSQKLNNNETEQLITAALSDGRLTAGADEQWARKLASKDIGLLKEHLGQRQPIAALSRTQTGGQVPDGQDKPRDLDAQGLAICSQFGFTADDLFKEGN